MHADDICLWPDGFWCYRCELEECLAGRSDDFEFIAVGTPRYAQLIQDEEGA